MHFNTCLRLVGKAIQVDPATLANYAAQDTWGGARNGWRGESITRQEGQIIYAIVRALRPGNMLEYGVCGACSSTHILQALSDNHFGTLTSFDVNEVIPPGPPGALRSRWKFIKKNGIVYEYGTYHCDICFEDTSHTHHSTTNLVQKALDLGAKCILIHDAVNKTSGSEVRRALDDVLGKRKYALIVPDDSKLGLALWVRNGA